MTAAPDLDGWAITERLLTDLVRLEDRLWLVIDDMHELGSAEARSQLELLMRGRGLAARHAVPPPVGGNGRARARPPSAGPRGRGRREHVARGDRSPGPDPAACGLRTRPAAVR